jgi:type I restriction enzyme S subunit
MSSVASQSMNEWQETDFGRIPKEWDVKKVDDIKSEDKRAIAMGPFGSNIKAENFVEHGVPVIRGTNLNYARYIGGEFVYLTEEKADDLLSSNCKAGDLVFTHRGTIGQVGLIPHGKFSRYVVSQSGMKLTVNSDLMDSNFLLYFFKSDYGQYQILKYESQVGVPSISNPLTSLKAIEVPTPPRPEQKAIAAVLSSLDDKIDLLHRQNKTLEAMAETLFRQWFIEEAQEDWEDTNLEKHTDAYRGLSYKGSGLSDVGLGLPMHNLNSVYEGGGYKEGGIKYYSGEVKERHFVKAGDIIVANTEQGHEFKLIGFPAIVPTHFGDRGLFSQHIYRLASKPDSYLTSEYLYYLLMTPLVREQIISATNGSTVNMLAIDGLQRPEFKLPSKAKVVEFTAMVKAWWKKKEVNHSQIRTLEKLRDTLLPKLMSGEVRVEH